MIYKLQYDSQLVRGDSMLSRNSQYLEDKHQIRLHYRSSTKLGGPFSTMKNKNQLKAGNSGILGRLHMVSERWGAIMKAR